MVHRETPVVTNVLASRFKFPYVYAQSRSHTDSSFLPHRLRSNVGRLVRLSTHCRSMPSYAKEHTLRENMPRDFASGNGITCIKCIWNQSNPPKSSQFENCPDQGKIFHSPIPRSFEGPQVSVHRRYELQ